MQALIPRACLSRPTLRPCGSCTCLLAEALVCGGGGQASARDVDAFAPLWQHGMPAACMVRAPCTELIRHDGGAFRRHGIETCSCPYAPSATCDNMLQLQLCRSSANIAHWLQRKTTLELKARSC